MASRRGLWTEAAPQLGGPASSDGLAGFWAALRTQEERPQITMKGHGAAVPPSAHAKAQVVAPCLLVSLPPRWDVRALQQPVQELAAHTFAVRRVRFCPHSAAQASSE